jgi:protein TonB
MFEQALATEFHYAHRAWSTLAGMTAQVTLVAAAVVAPMMSPDTLPMYRTLISNCRIWISPPPPPPPPPAENAVQRTATKEPRFQVRDGRVFVPVAMPDKPLQIEDSLDMPPATGSGIIGGVQGGVDGGKIGGVVGAFNVDASRLLAPPPVAVKPVVQQTVPPPAAVAAITQVRKGGQVQEALLIRRVIPAYPVLARQVRVQGIVELMGVIAIDGRVKELRVVSGNPLLVGAALDGVRQWLYRPTYLNGNPVEVVCPITVYFKLE